MIAIHASSQRKYVFLTTHAARPGYRNLAIIECDPDHTPRTIRSRKGNARIINVRYGVYIGSARSEGYNLAQFMADMTNQLNEHEKSFAERWA